jgi:hypothetical protein
VATPADASQHLPGKHMWTNRRTGNRQNNHAHQQLKDRDLASGSDKPITRIQAVD